MWFPIFCLAMFFVTSIASCIICEKVRGYEYFEDTLSSFGLSFIVWAVVFIGGSLYMHSSEKEMEFSHKINITALKDNSNIEGSGYYLGGRNINEQQYYYFMMNTSKGERMFKVKTNKAYINEGDYEPHVMVYDEVLKGKIARLIWGSKVYDDEAEFVFYVPNKTITNEFEIDME